MSHESDSFECDYWFLWVMKLLLIRMKERMSYYDVIKMNNQ